MSDSEAPLFMARMRFDTPGLIGLARRRRLPVQQLDLGYIVHIQLGELFGDHAPGPFRIISDHGRWLTVLAYTAHNREELHAMAQTYADPAVYSTCDWDNLNTKPMPSIWSTARPLSFEIRVCPVVRMASAGVHWRKGAEVDAFLSACWKTGDRAVPVDRESVYRDWLSKRLEDRGASPKKIEMRSHQRERLTRRTQSDKRKAVSSDRPAVTLSGELTVLDPAKFAQSLARGIGRHRAFGFGMLLLSRGR